MKTRVYLNIEQTRKINDTPPQETKTTTKEEHIIAIEEINEERTAITQTSEINAEIIALLTNALESTQKINGSFTSIHVHTHPTSI